MSLWHCTTRSWHFTFLATLVNREACHTQKRGPLNFVHRLVCTPTHEYKQSFEYSRVPRNTFVGCLRNESTQPNETSRDQTDKSSWTTGRSNLPVPQLAWWNEQEVTVWVLKSAFLSNKSVPADVSALCSRTLFQASHTIRLSSVQFAHLIPRVNSTVLLKGFWMLHAPSRCFDIRLLVARVPLRATDVHPRWRN